MQTQPNIDDVAADEIETPSPPSETSDEYENDNDKEQMYTISAKVSNQENIREDDLLNECKPDQCLIQAINQSIYKSHMVKDEDLDKRNNHIQYWLMLTNNIELNDDIFLEQIRFEEKKNEELEVPRRLIQ